MTAFAPQFPQVLAITFGSPALLGGLLLVGVPILLHWLYRRPQREEPWAAMDILRRALAKRSQRMRLQTLLLLAVRMLLIAAAALAFARPFATGLAGSAAATRAVHRVLVIDDTLSMQSEERGEPLLDFAKQLAGRILESANPGDAFRVVKIGPLSSLNEVVPRWSSDVTAITAEIDRLSPTDGFGSPYATLRAVVAGLESDSPGARAEVIVLSDFQRANWQGENVRSVTMAPVAESLSRLAKLALIPLGDRQAENLAVTSIRTQDSTVRSQGATPIVASIENTGRIPRSQVPVEVLVAGTVRGATRIDVAAGQRTEARISVRFDNAGTVPLELRIPSDPLPADNTARLAVHVRDQLRVLLVDRADRSGRNSRPSEFVRLALNPESIRSPETAPATLGPIDVRQIEDVNLRDADLSAWDCVYLVGIARLTRTESQRLEQYVARGGAVIVGAGPELDIDNWNSQLFRDGTGPLPARLAGWENIGESKATFALNSPPHAILDPFVGNPDAGLTTTRVWEFMRTENPAGTPIVELSSSRPAILEKRFGQGICLLCAVALDGRGTNWAVWPSFLPMIQELTSYSIAASDPKPAFAGGPIAFSSSGIAGTVSIVRPDGAEVERAVTTAVDGAFKYEETEQAGFYSLKGGTASIPDAEAAQYAAVNPDPRESRLDRLAAEDLRAIFGSSASIQTDWQPRSAELSASDTVERELARPVLWALLALMLIEAVLTWRFHWGAGLAAALLIAAVLWPIGGAWPATLIGACGGTALAMRLGGTRPRLTSR